MMVGFGERRSDVAKRAVGVIEKETANFSGTIVLSKSLSQTYSFVSAPHLHS